MSDLKPCIICGNEVRIDEFYDPFITFECDHCATSVSIHAHTKQVGIDKWNKRDDGWVSVDITPNKTNK